MKSTIAMCLYFPRYWATSNYSQVFAWSVAVFSFIVMFISVSVVTVLYQITAFICLLTKICAFTFSRFLTGSSWFWYMFTVLFFMFQRKTWMFSCDQNLMMTSFIEYICPIIFLSSSMALNVGRPRSLVWRTSVHLPMMTENSFPMLVFSKYFFFTWISTSFYQILIQVLLSVLS